MKKNLILLGVIFIIILSIVFYFIFLNETEPIATYCPNEQGRFREISEIQDEQFDDFGNLIHYKYYAKQDDGSVENLEFNIKYTFDDNNNITSVTDNYNNKIEIQYDIQNRISKLTNLYNFSQDSNIFYEYTIKYEDLNTIINSTKIYNNDVNNQEKYTYILTLVEENGKKYISADMYKDEVVTCNFLYEALEKEINNSNIFSLLDMDFYGYVSLDLNIKPSNFEISVPLFNTGKLVHIKYSDLQTDCYYDSIGRILKFVDGNENVQYYIYSNQSDKKYTGYCLEKTNNNCRKIEFKDYLENNKLIKREIIKSDVISIDEYEKQYNKFNKYFENNKVL